MTIEDNSTEDQYYKLFIVKHSCEYNPFVDFITNTCKLNPREKWVLHHRAGAILGVGGNMSTLRQAGDIYPSGRVTPERIRQIECKVRRKTSRYLSLAKSLIDTHNKREEQEKKKAIEELNKELDENIDRLEHLERNAFSTFSVRLANALRFDGITTISALTKLTWRDVGKIPNLGAVSKRELKWFLDQSCIELKPY